MSNNEANYRGAIQAQGQDISINGGHTRSWAQNNPLTDAEGLCFLHEIENECTDFQREQRKTAFAKAKRFIDNASKEGGVTPESQPHSFQDIKRTIASLNQFGKSIILFQIRRIKKFIFEENFYQSFNCCKTFAAIIEAPNKVFDL